MKRFAICVLMVLAASVVLASTAAKDLYVPAASRALGAFGTDWRSDVRAYNPNTAAATVTISYLPMAQFTSHGTSISRTIPAGSTVVWENIMEEEFGIAPNTAGALHFVSNVDIYVETRIFTPDADGAGTFGQRVPGIPASQAVAAGETVDILYIDNLSASDGFRTNFGLVEAGGAARAPVAYTLTAYDMDGGVLGTPYSGTVASGQWDQFNALGKLGVSGDVQYARLMFTVTSGKAIPYASQADNDTGDAMFVDGTRIKASGGGGGDNCGTGTLYGYFQQYNNGNWEGSIQHGLIWWLDDFSFWAMADNTPENPDDDDWYWWVNYITPTNYVLSLPYGGVFETPLALADGQAFDFSFMLDYIDDTNTKILQATYHISGTFACPNYVNGLMDALVKALDPDWKDFAGKWYWRFEGGVK